MVAQRGGSSRGVFVDPFTAGGLSTRSGIVAGTVQQQADALEYTPDELLNAVSRSSVEPMVDTVKQKEKKDGDRLTDPEMRYLAFLERDFRRVAAIVGAREATDADSVLAEVR